MKSFFIKVNQATIAMEDIPYNDKNALAIVSEATKRAIDSCSKFKEYKELKAQ